MKNFKEFKEEVLKNSAVKKAYKDLGPEFALIRIVIEKRIQRKLTQGQLAKKMGSRQPVISRFESGTYNPSVKFLRRMAKALDVKLSISIY